MFTGSVSLTALLGAVGMASAQTVAPEPSQAEGIQEVVVTAQKREQRLQDVPIAITAVSQETLQVNRVQTVMDLNGLAPGLLARVNAGGNGSPSFSMRGVFASASQPSSDRQISTYVDGVYIGATRGSVFDLPDVERIEVLRGPQGTLFGRNATAGAVSVITRNPTGTLGFRQELTVGNYDQLRSRTTVETPEIGPFSAYFTYVHDERRGDVRNLGAGTAFDRTNPFTSIGRSTSPKYLGNKNSENFFAAVKFEPSDALRMVYKYDRSDTDTTPEARISNVINPNSLVGGLLLGVIATQPAGGGAFGPYFPIPENKRPKAYNNAFTQPGYLKAQGHSLTTTFLASDNFSVKNISAYRRSSTYSPSTIMGISGLEYTAATKAFYTAPLAFLGGASFAQIFGNGNAPLGSYFAGYESTAYGKQSQYSTELQGNYDSELLTLTVGGIYYHSKELSSGLPGFPANFAFSPLPELLPLGNVQEARSKTESIAGYAQAEVHVTPTLDIVAGGRYTKDKKTVSFTTGGVFTGTRQDGVLTGLIVDNGVFKKSKPTFSVGANYKPTEDVLVYGKYSTAFLSGGSVGSLAFKPETVKSIEGGLKTDWFDRRLRANLAVYNAVYKHSQSSQSGSNVGRPDLGVVVIDNGTLKAKGVELEVTVAPVVGFSMNGSLGYTDARNTSPSPLIAQGNRYKTTGMPKWIGSVNAQYETQPIFDDASLFFRLDANYQGKYRAGTDPDIEVRIPVFGPYEYTESRWIVNGRAALRKISIGSARGEIALWGRNLFNNKSAAYQLQFGDIQVDASYQPARTYGVDFIITL